MNSIDDLLGGGVWSGEVAEVWGPAGSGKTQVRVINIASEVVSHL